MPFIPFDPGTVEYVINWTQNGVPCIITLGYYFRTGAAVVSDGQNLVDTLRAGFVSDIMGDMSPEMIYDNSKAVELSTSTSWMASEATFTVGRAGGSPVANQAALVITFNTDFRGRSFRGRNYIPGLPASKQDSSIFWKATTIADYQTSYENMNSAVYAIGWQHCVLSRYHLGAPRVLGVRTDVVSYSPKLLIATQRGRLT